MLKYYQLKPRVGASRPGFAASNEQELAFVIDDRGTQEVTRMPKPEAALGRLRAKYAITELKPEEVSEAMRLVLDAELSPKGAGDPPPPPPDGGSDDDETRGAILSLEQRVAALEALIKGLTDKKADDIQGDKPAGGE